MNRELQLICVTAGVAVATFLVGAHEYLLGVVVILVALILTTAAQMFEHRINSRAWERRDDFEGDED